MIEFDFLLNCETRDDWLFVRQVCKNRYTGDLGVMPLEFHKDSLSFAQRKKAKTSSKSTSGAEDTKGLWEQSTNTCTIYWWHHQGRRTKSKPMKNTGKKVQVIWFFIFLTYLISRRHLDPPPFPYPPSVLTPKLRIPQQQ